MAKTARVYVVLAIFAVFISQALTGFLAVSARNETARRSLSASPHVTITNSDSSAPMVFNSKLRGTIKKDGNVSRVLPQRSVPALFSGSNITAPLTVRSGNPQTMDDVYSISAGLVRGVYILNKSEIVIGKGLADRYGLQPGRHIVLMLAGQTNIALRITAIVDFGNRQQNETLAYTGEGFGQAALGLKDNEYSSVVIQLKDVFKSADTAKALSAGGGGISVFDWRQEQRGLAAALDGLTLSTIIVLSLTSLAGILTITALLCLRKDAK